MFKKILDRLYYSYEMLAYHMPLFAAAYITFHEPSVKKELSLLQIEPTANVLHIGCGAIPYTSLIVTRETGARVTGIDNKTPVVTNAVHCLHRYHLSDKICITQGEGSTYDVSSFEVIIISHGIANQEQIVRHVLVSSKQGTRILIRTSTAKQNPLLMKLLQHLIVDRVHLLLTQESILVITSNTD